MSDLRSWNTLVVYIYIYIYADYYSSGGESSEITEVAQIVYIAARV